MQKCYVNTFQKMYFSFVVFELDHCNDFTAWIIEVPFYAYSSSK